MGDCFNPGNESFRNIINNRYVDKTGLIAYVNGTINKTPDRMTCFSRPRRFGKSFAAKMLCAYYDESCDSHSLFDGLAISRMESYERHLNRYPVIYLDMSRFMSESRNRHQDVLQIMQNTVIDELRGQYPDSVKAGEAYLPNALLDVCTDTGKKVIVIIDEWDAIFREAKEDQSLQEDYVLLLRRLFKSGPATDKTIAAAYMTGILPIKKYGTQSALTDFCEFTMLRPGKLAEYVGFTEKEVETLCGEYQMDMEGMRNWYDGYSFSTLQHVYNPYSVMQAISSRELDNYWNMSETFLTLTYCITMNFDGLKDAIIAMLGGQSIYVRISSFQNDMSSFRNKDDVLTLLVHMGYLSYDKGSEKVRIPNQEVAEVFRDAVIDSRWEGVMEALEQSENLLDATLRGDADAVAEALELVHESSSSVLRYNNEASLSSAIVIAYYTARRYYKIVQEFPQGKGFVDLAFLPHPGVDRPAMIVELKYNRDADTAIRQIHENRYEGDLKEYYGNLLLVGINYDKEAKGADAKHHTCLIEQV